MSRSGLEWLFRLAQEPRRLARRYLIDDPQFLAILYRTMRVPKSERIIFALADTVAARGHREPAHFVGELVERLGLLR